MIAVENLSVRAGSFALEDISFTVPGGSYCVLMGRTGSGKTTLLEAICGLKRIVGGSVLLHGRDVTALSPADRGIGFVPQDGALFSTMTVEDHLAFSLSVRRWPRDQVRRRVEELAELLGIGHILGRRPPGLSGGERQRVALGRALAFRPDVLCLDEPLSALDEATRQEMCKLLTSVREETSVTTLHITHSSLEAKSVGDLVLLLDGGQVKPHPAGGAERLESSEVLT